MPISLFGQSKFDYHWALGYDTSLFDPGGDVIIINFNFNPVNIQTLKTVERFDASGANTSMSDSSGKLIFYTSGCNLFNSMRQVMQNGDSLNPGIIWKYYCLQGGNSPNTGGAIAIPWPDSPHLYLVFINDYESIKFPGEPFTVTGASAHLYYNVVDMNQDGGLGAVTLKNQVLIADTLSPNSIEACRHANGHDWWVLIPVPRSNCYYLTLVTAAGPQTPRLVCTGIPWDLNDQVGQSFFTPDTKKFIRFNSWNGIRIYDFDNETGVLSNQVVVPTPDITSNNVGATVSPNSRYLYVCAVTRLFQYDLEAPDIADSRVLILYYDTIPDPFYPSGFILAATAPDGKVYVSSGSTHLSLHVVHRPDCPGLYSLPERRGLKLSSWNFYCIPNMPFYRDEPYPGECDSMVVHSYTPVDGDKRVIVYPNPATEQVKLIVNRPLPTGSDWVLFDSAGREVRRQSLEKGLGDYSIAVDDLAAGMYFFNIQTTDRILETGKLVIVLSP